MKTLNDIYGDGFDNIFVSDNGDIISYRSGQPKILKTYSDKKGYQYIKIWNSHHKRYVHISVHRTVALAFILNPNNKPEVNHKNRIKSNNNSDNLEWVTRLENVIHANNPIRNNTICELWYNGILIDKFDSKSQACRYASGHYNVGKDALMKYGKSKGCVIIEKV